MPYWLQKQLRQAFLKKDRYRILVLNDCWYFYKNIEDPSMKKACKER